MALEDQHKYKFVAGNTSADLASLFYYTTIVGGTIYWAENSAVQLHTPELRRHLGQACGRELIRSTAPEIYF